MLTQDNSGAVQVDEKSRKLWWMMDDLGGRADSLRQVIGQLEEQVQGLLDQVPCEVAKEDLPPEQCEVAQRLKTIDRDIIWSYDMIMSIRERLII